MSLCIKRIFDVIGSFGLILFFSPIMGMVSLCIALTMGRPIIFRQRRVGLRETIFTMYKFRTMDNRVDEEEHLLPGGERITKFGRVLRKTSLDELPELINVLKGDMSLVGPRPLLVDYLKRYNAKQRKRHDVKPGITGWAQVNGRNNITWEEKFERDVWYVEHHSFLLDIKILFKTISIVVKQQGVSKDGYETTDPFKGSKG